VAGGLTLEDGPGGASAGPFDGQAVTLAVGARFLCLVRLSPG
jgi:hypothetical protein